MTVSTHILACIDAILKTSTKEAFDEKLRSLGWKIVPADAATTPEIMSWETWQLAQDALNRPGWSFGKLALRTHDGLADFKIGWLSGAFGIWKQVGVLAAVQPDGNSLVQEGAEFFHMVHLRTGCRLGTFVDLDAACSAAELAERVGRWTDVNDISGPLWVALCSRTSSAWSEIGMVYDPTVSANGMPGVTMRHDETLEYNRPEKLS